MRAYVRECVCMRVVLVPQHNTCGGIRTMFRSWSLHHLGPRGQTQVVRLGGSCLSTVKLLTSLSLLTLG